MPAFLVSINYCNLLTLLLKVLILIVKRVIWGAQGSRKLIEPKYSDNKDIL